MEYGLEKYGDSQAEREPTDIKLGLAVSNLANHLNPGFEIPSNLTSMVALAAYNQMGVELELEGDLDFSAVSTRFRLHRPPFIGVHQPVKAIDALSEDMHLRSYSSDRIRQAMIMAERLRADYFTVHLQTVDRDWADLQARQAQIKASWEVFDEQISFYNRTDLSIPILVENLEYPKYPATPEEIGEVVSHLLASDLLSTGVVLDIGHLWRSRDLMTEAGLINSGDNLSYEDYLQSTIDSYGGQVKVVHYTGCRGFQTHLLPELNLPPEQPINDPDLLIHPNNEYNFRQIGDLLFRFASQQTLPPYLVNEAFGNPYTAVIQNNHDIFETFWPIK